MRHSCHSYSVLSLAHSGDRGVASGRNVRHFKTRIGIILGTICRKHPMRGRWHTLNFQNAFEVEFSAECITSLTICITVGEIILQKSTVENVLRHVLYSTCIEGSCEAFYRVCVRAGSVLLALVHVRRGGQVRVGSLVLNQRFHCRRVRRELWFLA